MVNLSKNQLNKINQVVLCLSMKVEGTNNLKRLVIVQIQVKEIQLCSHERDYTEKR